MRPLQLQVVGQLRKTLGSEVAPSDVTFIATKPNPGEDMILSYEEQLLRAGRLRYCLTPALAKLMKEKNIPDPRTV